MAVYQLREDGPPWLLTKGLSRLTAKTHATGRTVHWLHDGEPLCGRRPTNGFTQTDLDVSCRWCLRNAGRREQSVHRPKWFCADCGVPWPCPEAPSEQP